MGDNLITDAQPYFTVTLLDASESDPTDAKGNKLRRVRGIGSTVDEVNLNQRKYPKEVMEDAIKKLKKDRKNEKFLVFGESGHPTDKSQWADLPHETVIGWEKVSLKKDGHVHVDGVIFPTSRGEEITTLLEQGVDFGLSQRARGFSEYKNGVEIVQSMRIRGYDLVMDPADVNSGIEKFERVNSDKGDDPMGKETNNKNDGITSSPAPQPAAIAPREAIAEVVRARVDGLDFPEAVRDRLYDQVMALNLESIAQAKQHLDSFVSQLNDIQTATGSQLTTIIEALNLQPGQDPVEAIQNLNTQSVELAQKELDREIAEALDEHTTGEKAPKYAPIIMEQYAEMVRDLKVESVDEVEGAIEGLKAHFDAMQAKFELAAKGLKESHGITVLGPVWEIETGMAEYFRPSMELLEHVDEYKRRPRTDLAKLNSPAHLFMKKYLKKFDEAHKSILKQEWQQYQDTLTSMELNIPYTVSRTIIIEAIPAIVAFSVFDIGTTDSMSTRVYFEQYTPEAGAEVAFSESAVATPLDEWVQLTDSGNGGRDIARIQFGTLTANIAAGAALTEGDDFIVDYTNGRIMVLSAGSGTASTDVAGTYDAVRLGEDAEIQRAKTVLTFKLLEAAADRLATKITDESIKYSRSQLGWDAVSRGVSNLAREVTRRIDSNLFAKGLEAVLLVPNNNAGTVTLATDEPGVMAELVGKARVLVTDRGYMANAVILSTGNADWLSNWESFTAAGTRPDSDLDAAGYVGRVKGLPVFESPVFSDGYGLVCDRELVGHRIYSPMVTKGPFPTYGPNMHLTGAEEYYIEEYNSSDYLLEDKGSYFKIA